MSKSTSDEGEGGDALIHLRVSPALKGRWARESRAAGMRLTDWIVARVDGQKGGVIMAQVAIQVDGEITVGTVVQGAATEGETVTVELHDENGMPIEATGVVVEVLED